MTTRGRVVSDAAAAIDEAAAEIERRRAESVAAEQARECEIWLRYVEILRRVDAPEDGDVGTLGELAVELGFSPEGFRNHAGIVRKAVERQHLHDQRDGSVRPSAAAYEEYALMLSRHKEEERQLFFARRHAEDHRSRCHGAAGELQQLQQLRPELFDDGDPPRLLGSPAPPAPETAPPVEPAGAEPAAPPEPASPAPAVGVPPRKTKRARAR